MVSGYLRLPFKPKVDFVMISLTLVSTFTIFLLLFAMNIRSTHKRKQNLCRHRSNHLHAQVDRKYFAHFKEISKLSAANINSAVVP